MIKDEGAACKDLRYTSQSPSAKIEDKTTAKTPPQGCNNGGANGVIIANPNGLAGDPMDQDNTIIVDSEKDNLWLDGDSQENLLGVNESSIFYTDFPSLPDFPCMSSSSSSSSNPKPLVSASSSSSSAASSSWAAVRSSDADERCTGNLVKAEQHNTSGSGAALSSTASMEVQPPISDLDCCIDDAMENFGYMDLIDVNEIWDDPSNSVFDGGNPIQGFENHPQSMIFDASPQEQAMMMHHHHHQQQQTHEEEEDDSNCPNEDGLGSLLEGNAELGMIFFEWLKQNREYITAEDVRSIRLKRATIETATKRLGNTIEGKKRLLRLILDWVEKCQLQKKRENGSTSQEQLNSTYPETPHLQNTPDLEQNPNPNDPNQSFPYNHHPMAANDPTAACFSTPPWIQPPPQEAVPVMASYPPQPVPMYPCDHPYSNAVQIPPMAHHQVMSNGPIPYPHFGEYPVMDHPQSWAMPPPPYTIPAQPQLSPYPDRAAPIVTHQPAFYPSPYPMYDPNGERLVRLGASATKEARKKRMARQRRVLSSHHHQRHSGHANHHQLLQDQMMGDADLIGDDHRDAGEDKMFSDQAGSSGNNWVYNWSSSGGGTGTSANADSTQPSAADRVSVQPQNNQRQGSSDRRQQQGWKTEKNLKFLLQKVLKQSDVGNLGRIVLPKKEAESHLPELETRDGISVAMEDIGTSRVWNMRYRFWPNNKSRMYLLENTGDFVRVNGLQEGDFIVIYSDTKCGKYMIRGVKVRPGAKQESKKPVRKNSRSLSIGGGNNSSSLAQIKQALD